MFRYQLIGQRFLHQLQNHHPRSIIPPVQSTISTGKTSPALTSATGGISGPTVVDREFLLPRLLLQVCWQY
ncbi:hypothetical protein POPTR_007G053750v4 [Populus trichocarpa]|uniref:Uncharacterized protein n=1 Tax=Populus trichocarpa TaxID=3694 RepID=A0ACC0SPM1_POPTR|nr:hypothetical protein POPTR_007G053750v4 [Populus trichocarpa]